MPAKLLTKLLDGCSLQKLLFEDVIVSFFPRHIGFGMGFAHFGNFLLPAAGLRFFTGFFPVS